MRGFGAKVISAIMGLTAMFSACSLDGEYTGRFLVLIFISVAWLMFYAYENDYLV